MLVDRWFLSISMPLRQFHLYNLDEMGKRTHEIGSYRKTSIDFEDSIPSSHNLSRNQNIQRQIGSSFCISHTGETAVSK